MHRTAGTRRIVWLFLRSGRLRFSSLFSQPPVPPTGSPLQEHLIRPLLYSINVTLDGCYDHRAIPAHEDLHRHATETLARADWNAELVRGDLGKAVQQLKQEPGKGLYVAGVKLPLALAELGLIDEHEFIVHPGLAGHGPTLFAGLSKHVDLKLVNRLEFGSRAVAMRYAPGGGHWD